MMTVTISPLRGLLALDAGTCGAMGALLLFGGKAIAEWTLLPYPLLQWAGLLLIPSTLAMACMAWRPLAAGVVLIVAGNALWVAASVAVLAMVGANALGVAFVLVQSIVVAGLALAELAAFRRPAAPVVTA